MGLYVDSAGYVRVSGSGGSGGGGGAQASPGQILFIVVGLIVVATILSGGDRATEWFDKRINPGPISAQEIGVAVYTDATQAQRDAEAWTASGTETHPVDYRLDDLNRPVSWLLRHDKQGDRYQARVLCIDGKFHPLIDKIKTP